MYISTSETKLGGLTPPELSAMLVNRISRQLFLHNWTLKTLSDKSGVSYETIKKIAGGKVHSPSLLNIMKIACAFGCTMDYLSGLEAEETSACQSRNAGTPDSMYSYLKSL